MSEAFSVEYGDNYAEQIDIETLYSKKHANALLVEAFKEVQSIQDNIDKGEALLKAWLAKDHGYPQKNARLKQLDGLLLRELVTDVFICTSYCLTPELFVSVSGRLASMLGFDDHRDSLVTVAEIIAVLSDTTAFLLDRPAENGSIYVTCELPLPQEVVTAIERAMFVPPMICPPKHINSNYESGYLTFNESILLGNGNGHNKEVCLDVINKQNAIGLTLNRDFLNTVPEIPNKPLETRDQLLNWEMFLKQSREIYHLIIKHGNEFWLTNNYDTRGRLYDKGYHVSTQGTSYKKAMIELKHKELVEVPDE